MDSGSENPVVESAEDRARRLRVRWFQPAEGGSGNLKDQALFTLKNECVKGNSKRPREMDLRSINLAGDDLTDLNLLGYDFSEANLSGTDLSGSNLAQADFRNANLYKAKLTGCEFLGADLTEANLNECSAERCGFGATKLDRASLISAKLSYASLSRSSLKEADLRAANLVKARINEADLTGASFIRADMRQADLKASNVARATFELADLSRARLLGLKNFTKAAWVGTDIRDMDLRGAYMIRRHIADTNYLYEFKSTSGWHKFLYYAWWLTSDCGRSLSRWAIWVLGLTIIFGFLYQVVDIDFGPHKTPFSAFYYSVVTLTTLGYGDVVPSSMAGQILAVVQAILGYMGLGGLLSIFSNKMARRAE